MKGLDFAIEAFFMLRCVDLYGFARLTEDLSSSSSPATGSSSK